MSWCSILCLGKTPLDVTGFPGMNVGDAERIEGGGAVIKEEDVRASILAVTSVDPFIFAVVNPEAIIHARHAHGADGAHGIHMDRAVIQGHAREGPEVGSASRAIDAVPAVDEKPFVLALCRIRPRLGALGIVTRRRIK